MTKEIKQLVQHGIISKVAADPGQLKIPSYATHYPVFTKMGQSATGKVKHGNDPERDKREQLKQQIINKHVEASQIKNVSIPDKKLQPVNHQ